MFYRNSACYDFLSKMHTMGLPAVETSVRGLQEESLENVCFAVEVRCCIGDCMQSKK